jgi:hypothetical protein
LGRLRFDLLLPRRALSLSLLFVLVGRRLRRESLPLDGDLLLAGGQLRLGPLVLGLEIQRRSLVGSLRFLMVQLALTLEALVAGDGARDLLRGAFHPVEEPA